MQLHLPTKGLDAYTSASQRARVATEAWAATNLFCPNCSCDELTSYGANNPAHDYSCQSCDAPFQLKSQSRPFTSKIVDAAYSTMIRAIEEDRTPNLVALQYHPEKWNVENVFLIPHFAFTRSMVEKRKPLAATARRAGWVGCNLLLSRISPDVRIDYVRSGVPINPKLIRKRYAALRPLESLGVKKRGWTLDVLNGIRSLGKREFSLADAYTLEGELQKLHPANRNVQPKIRQQLQVLRDVGLIAFLGHGSYRISGAA
jgi:type II restriction enzyme